jgi:hypothetical protein
MFSQGAGQATAGSAAAQAHSDVGAVRLRQGLEGRLSHRSGIGGTPLKAVRFEKLPRMADFARWAMACETASWPPGTCARAYEANRRAEIECQQRPRRWSPG